MKNVMAKVAVVAMAATITLSSSLAQAGWSWFGSKEKKAAATEPSELVIRYMPSHGNVSPHEVANALGWFKEAGIRLENVGYSTGGPESIVAVKAGGADLGSAATSAIINAIAGGANILGIVPTSGINETVNSKWYVLTDSPIRSAQDLKGKTIAVNTLGAHLDYVTREYLRQNGLTPADVKLITVPGPQLEQVLRHKQADVVATGAWQTSFSGKIAATGGVRVLFTDYQVLGDIVLAAGLVSETFAAQHPEGLKNFVSLIGKAVDWADQNPEEARKLFAQVLKDRGENPELAQYWAGWGIREHALLTKQDASFWLDALSREGGKLTPGQLAAEQIFSNKFNRHAGETKNAFAAK